MQEETANNQLTPDGLQILLFVDHRPSSQKQIEDILDCLEHLKIEYKFTLQVVSVEAEPYLAEYFKIMATPALIKVAPEPRHILAGSNLIVQLRNLWPYWQNAVEEYEAEIEQNVDNYYINSKTITSVAQSSEILQLSDQIFKLKKEQEELLEQLQFKDRVIALLAHDLRSPLTAASLALETLQTLQNSQNNLPVVQNYKNYQFNPSLIQRLIEQSRSQLKMMERMITDILEAARGNCVELNIVPHKLDLGRHCEDIINQMRDQLKAKSQLLETDIPQDLPYVYGDAERLRQVIVNLLENAIKYTPIGGQVFVSILHRTTQQVQVTIRDTGPGIPPENRERIFEEHFRLQRDKNQEGYGLGLSLCQTIIRAHYGHIWVDSMAHQPGSCFHFTLPVYL